ncbi:MAG TPA: hypothetical protein VFY14_09410 [Streptomyces sp.]|nr:hypothetical protein [Streptomyces sp.]
MLDHDGRLEAVRGYGGTVGVVVCAKRMGVPVRVLWPEGASRGWRDAWPGTDHRPGRSPVLRAPGAVG